MTISRKITVGVLALQGAFIEHIKHFEGATKNGYSDCEFEFIEVRTEEQLDRCHGLVIPGGESTAISLIAQRTNLLTLLMHYVRSEKPIWGTCAGLIFLSTQVENGKPGQQLLGGMSIQVKRNAFGRQLQSFQADLDFSSFISLVTDFPTIFIRAPVITSVLSDANGPKNVSDDIIHSKNDYENKAPVEILHQLDDGLIVAVRQGTKLGTSFHPELSSDYRFHKWFIDEFVVKAL